MNHPRSKWNRWTIAFAVVGVCLWGPFSWILFITPPLSSPQLGWLILWPILPGFFPAGYLFYANGALATPAMGVITLFMISGLTWVGARGWIWLMVAAILALLCSIPSAGLSHACYLA
jgi:hypothetical protein